MTTTRHTPRESLKLTHDKARSIFKWLERNGQPDECDHDCDHDCDERCDECEPLHLIQAFCDEWIARHTVRWEYDADGCTLVTGDGRHMWRTETVCRMTLEARARRAYGDWVQFTTRRPAEAWCEEQALAEGYEVER